MKRLFFPVLAIVLLATACNKTTTTTSTACTYQDTSTARASAAEVLAIQNYLSSKGITDAVEDTSCGLFYKVTTVGTGAVPGVCSTIGVQYYGKLTNDNLFDSNTYGTSFVLGGTIIGWQKGLHHMAAGTVLDLYIPPTLGYGVYGSGTPGTSGYIPPNSILIFHISLNSVR